VNCPALVAACGAFAFACSGSNLTEGTIEPIHVHDQLLKEDAQFRAGKLPGSKPLTAAEVAAGARPASPSITSLPAQNGVTFAGATDKVFLGRASSDAAAVAVQLAGAGSGYWIVPVGASDPLNNDELQFGVTIDFGDQAKAGSRDLLFVALDEHHRAGTQFDQPLCIGPVIPDNLNACRPTIAPPELVISLAWDTPVDLDLELVTPEAKLVDPKHPSTVSAAGDAGVPSPLPADVGTLDRDSNAGCVVDGHQREDLVFQEKPAKGHYLVYANLFDSCGQASVRFDLTFHAARDGKKAGTFAVVQTFETSGELMQIQENGGAGRGLFVTEFDSK
jgi:hypothetical protein